MNTPDMHDPIELDRRRDRRERLLLRAKIVVGDGVYDCILLDQTAGGARIETLLPLTLPERFSLRFPDGRQLACERRWSSGRRMGVMLLRTGGKGGREEKAEAILQTFKDMHIEQFFGMLRSENFLQSTELGELAWQAESAVRRLGLALEDAAKGKDSPAEKPPGGAR